MPPVGFEPTIPVNERPQLHALDRPAIMNRHVKIDITVILLVLYGRETWSFTLREEHILRLFEDRVLRKIFGPKRGEVTGEWRRLHNEELNDLYS
jgi:hypothetical protein